MRRVNDKCVIKQYEIKENHLFPNNSLPVLHYKRALRMPVFMPGAFIRRLFARNNWKNSWRSGVLDYHHYHSITHEVLGVLKGKTSILLGGKNGLKITVEKGDVLIIPAGVAHKNLGDEDAITCIGAYPGGKEYDMNYGKKEERPKADKNIERVPLPEKDPVFGSRGGLKNYWSN